MSSLLHFADRCVGSTFATPDLYGANILKIEANLVTGFDYNVPKGWVFSQPALDVQNATFCNVTVHYTHTDLDDYIHVEAWMPPDEKYNGMLQSVGGSGWTAGRADFQYAAVINAVAYGYVSVTIDAGIPSADNGQNTLADQLKPWVLKSPGNVDINAFNNFGQTSLNDEAIIAKSLITSLYGKPPSFSYWNGCSQGGRQGMKLAQAYPDAYDGILSAAPAINWAEIYINSIWPQFYMDLTQQYPRDCELAEIASIAVSECDKLDGLEDGIIANPKACKSKFDPFKHVGKSFNCVSSSLNGTVKISKAAAAVSKASWDGPSYSNGQSMYGGFDIGAPLSVAATTKCTEHGCTKDDSKDVEFAWQAWVRRDFNATLPNQTHRDFDTIYRNIKLLFASNLETNEVDLSDFRDSGGKVIMFHGLADERLPSEGTLEYYKQVSQFAGGANDFFKYYQVPGLQHCHGGKGGQPEALFNQLRAWVENGTEPMSSAVVITAKDDSQQVQILCPWPEKANFDPSCTTHNSTTCWSCRK